MTSRKGLSVAQLSRHIKGVRVGSIDKSVGSMHVLLWSGTQQILLLWAVASPSSLHIMLDTLPFLIRTVQTMVATIYREASHAEQNPCISSSGQHSGPTVLCSCCDDRGTAAWLVASPTLHLDLTSMCRACSTSKGR